MDHLPSIFLDLGMRLVDASSSRKTGSPACSVLIASARHGEGKTFIARCLAAHLANVSNENVLLVDADFRHSGVKGEPLEAPGYGFSDCLLNGEVERAELRNTEIPNLKLLAAGGSRNPALLYRAHAMQAFLSAIASRFSMVIIDGGTVESCGCMPHVASGIVMVIDSQKTRREVVQGAMSGLNVERNKYYGVILNRKAKYIPKTLYKSF
jgi:Mrp family chromosome partitioning ATPase